MTSNQEPSPSRPVVNTESGSVTLVDLATLHGRWQELDRVAKEHAAQAASLHTLANTLWVQRGRVLASSTGRWSAPAELAPLMQEALPLVQEGDADKARLQAIKDEPGVLSKVAHWNESRHLSSDLTKVDAQLDPVLAQLGQKAPDSTLPEADIFRSQAVAAEAQATDHEARAKEASESASTLAAEVKRRSESESAMGFDALLLAAQLQTAGPPRVDSPLVLKRGEQAVMTMSATLARNQTRRQWVGGSSGFSFPIGHTGIRYRVGSYRGHPVEQTSLTRLDTGTLVVSNQRLAFIGQAKSTSAPLQKLLHIECYKDGLAVFREGRETPDFYLVAQPQYALFMINWLLDRAAQAARSAPEVAGPR